MISIQRTLLTAVSTAGLALTLNSPIHAQEALPELPELPEDSPFMTIRIMPEIQEITPELIIQTVLEKAIEKHVNGPTFNLDKLIEIAEEARETVATAGITDSESITTYGLNAALSTMDPHSSYIPPSELEEFYNDSRGQFSGIGAEVTVDLTEAEKEENDARREALIEQSKAEDWSTLQLSARLELEFPAPLLHQGVKVVKTVNETVPAAIAGFQEDDIITHVTETARELDHLPFAGLTLNEAVDYIRGPTGSDATFTVIRDGETIELGLTRDAIIMNPVSYKMDSPDTGYASLSQYTNQSDPNLDSAIRDLNGQGMEKFILDLRNNSGGLLDQADRVVENFIDGDPRIMDYLENIPRTRVSITTDALLDVFFIDNPEAENDPEAKKKIPNPEKLDEAAANLNTQEATLISEWLHGYGRLSTIDDVIAILEKYGYIEPGEYILPEITPELEELARDSTFISVRNIDRKAPSAFVTPGAETDAPMVVIQNGGSASASEITAAALQEFERATVVGTQSFGKSTVQTIMPIDANHDGEPDGALRITTALYYVGKNEGYNLNGIGVTPDVLVSDEFTAVTAPARTEASLDHTIAAPDDVNYSHQSSYICKPIDVEIKNGDSLIGHFN